MQIIHRGERRDARACEREGNNCEASCATCQPFYVMFFFLFFSSEVYRFLSIFPHTHCASSVFRSAFTVTEHTKKGEITFRTRCTPPLSHLLSFSLVGRTHAFLFFFFPRAEIHGRTEEVASEPLGAIENRKKSLLKTFFVATCI